MKRIIAASLAILCAFSVARATPCGPTQANTSSAQSTNSNTKKRGPIFRASKEQIKQAQAILKQRGFYQGEQTGKLDASTRAGLKQYQQTEGIKITGTLNRATLEKMSITLTDKQKAM
ncbi:MAG TPA: peptidoglycan-binding domain-containing protein [Pyrinomonadaceae bacterium]|jgi:peptidoglycan hydrolase-like protein with peptidoglycan-binding domain